MKYLKRIVGSVFVLVLVLIFGVYWNESVKEIRVLHGFISEGTPYDKVISTLETANLLDYTVVASGNEKIIAMSSYYSLKTHKKVIYVDENGFVK